VPPSAPAVPPALVPPAPAPAAPLASPPVAPPVPPDAPREPATSEPIVARVEPRARPASDVPPARGPAWADRERPTADAGPDHTVDAIGGWAAVDLEAGAVDRDGVRFRWSGSFGEADGRTVTVSLPLGVHTVRLTVEADGAIATDTVVVTVRDPTPPVIEARITPEPDAHGVVPGPATLTWVVDDPESGVVWMEGCEDARVTQTTELRCAAGNGAGQTTTQVLAVTVRPPRR